MSQFFSLDGVDGTGKSTQAALLSAWLREQGREVVSCRDPGSTPLGELLRSIVLEDRGTPIDRKSEMLIYMAARAQLVEQVIRPALAEGKIVVSDRFLLANVVYQGHAGGLDPAELWKIGRIATGGLSPCASFVLDMPAESAAARIARAPDRMESQGTDFLRRVREGFLAEARRGGKTIFVIDADRPVDEIQRDIRAAAAPFLAK